MLMNRVVDNGDSAVTKDTITNRLRETQHLIGAILEAVAKLESQITGQSAYNSLSAESQKRPEPAGLGGIVVDSHALLKEIQERVENLNRIL